MMRTVLLPPSQNMQVYQEQRRSQPMFSPACMSTTYSRYQGWGQIRFIKYKYKYKYIFFRSFKYKYKYKYSGKNLIKYKYKYKYSLSNTNTNTNTQWGRDKIAAILQMTYQNLLYCKKIVLFIRISLKIVSKDTIYN